MRRVETAPLLPARDYAYYHQVLDGVRLPAAFVDLDALTANLQQLGKRAGRLPVRLVTKSIRSVEMMRMIMSAAPFVQGLLAQQRNRRLDLFRPEQTLGIFLQPVEPIEGA